MRVARLQTPNMYVLSCENHTFQMHVDTHRPELLFMKLASQATKVRDKNQPVMCYSVHIIASFLDDLHNDAEERCLYLEFEASNLLTASANSLGTQCCKTVRICVGECL